MIKFSKFFLATILTCLFLSSQVYAFSNWDDFTLNFSAVADILPGGVGVDIEGVDEMGFKGLSAIAFNDLDNSSGISAGDTFDDYFAIRFDKFFEVGTGDDILADTGNNSYGFDYQLTAIGKASGYQSSDLTYVIDNLDYLNFYVDDGDDFTNATTTDLDTYVDGVFVESATLVAGGGTNLAGGGVSGTFDLFMMLIDELHNHNDTDEYFEVYEDGSHPPLDFVMGIADSNNTDVTGSADLAPFESYFGFNEADYDFVLMGNNNGSLNKTIVPEPTTMFLFGIGLLGIAGVSRRKRLS